MDQKHYNSNNLNNILKETEPTFTYEQQTCECQKWLLYQQDLYW